MKKGDPKALTGHIVVYARLRQPDAPENRTSPVYEMAKNGLLCASGDYRTQHTLEDFLKKELGLSLSDLSQPDNASIVGIPEQMNPDFLKRKIESLKGFEDLIPTPAKLMHYDSEADISNEEADIFYLGEFSKLGNANLAVNSLPILYQALYREQVGAKIVQEIEKLLQGASRDAAETGHYTDDLIHLENRILTEYVPEFLYNRDNPPELSKWIDRFKNFMSGYKYPADVETLITLSINASHQSGQKKGLLELYIRKIAAFLREDYKAVALLKREIEEYEALPG